MNPPPNREARSSQHRIEKLIEKLVRPVPIHSPNREAPPFYTYDREGERAGHRMEKLLTQTVHSSATLPEQKGRGVGRIQDTWLRNVIE